jgi:hypothetical protein
MFKKRTNLELRTKSTALPRNENSELPTKTTQINCMLFSRAVKNFGIAKKKHCILFSRAAQILYVRPKALDSVQQRSKKFGIANKSTVFCSSEKFGIALYFV